MNKKLFSSLIISLVFSLANVFAQEKTSFAQDMLAFDSGKSMAWYHNAYTLGLKDGAFVESEVLSVINNPEISYEAVRLGCKLLKESATDKSIPAMVKLIKGGAKPTPALEVLLAINNGKTDDALRGLIKENPENANLILNIAITLGKSGRVSNLAVLQELANSKNPEISKAAIVSIGQIKSVRSCLVLAELIKKGTSSANLFCVYNAFCKLENSVTFPDLFGSRADYISTVVPLDFANSISMRAERLKGAEKIEYLDKIIVSNSPNALTAARFAVGFRTFENSKILIDAYPKLSDRMKMLAINAFAETKDLRFFDLFKQDIDSPNRDLMRTVMFAAMIMNIEDKATLSKIISIYKGDDKDLTIFAENILAEIKTSDTLTGLIKNDKALRKIRILRGIDGEIEKLWNEYLTPENIKNPELERLVEQTLNTQFLKDFAQRYNKTSEDSVRSAITKILIKKLITFKNKDVMQSIALQILSGVSDMQDKNIQLIAEKLKIDLKSLPAASMKKVWQSKYFSRAVSDDKMHVSTIPVPNTNDDFTLIFNGNTLKGWAPVGGSATYSVQNGDIVGVCDPKAKKNTFLVYEKAYKDFIFVCDFKWDVTGNSGVMVRAEVDREQGSVKGPQIEMDSDLNRRWTGGLYGEGTKFAWLYSLSLEGHEAARNAVKIDSWNTMVVYCKGPIFRSWVNGVPCADVEWPEWTLEKGYIGLQVHSGKQGTIRWRNIKIKELK